jgi:hypothetical protein
MAENPAGDHRQTMCRFCHAGRPTDRAERERARADLARWAGTILQAPEAKGVSMPPDGVSDATATVVFADEVPPLAWQGR